MNRSVSLLNEDFRQFPLGAFPYDPRHSATGEYHMLANPGYTGGWVDPVVNYYYTGPSWIVTETEGVRHMEQMRLEPMTAAPHRMHPMLSKGGAAWRDYTLSVRLRLLNTHIPGEAGICFAYQNSLNTYAFILRCDCLCLVYRHKEEETLLASCPWAADSDRFITLTARLNGNMVQCYVDDQQVLTWSAPSPLRGKIAITANLPSQFEQVNVYCSTETKKALEHEEQEEANRLQLLRQSFPAMRLWRRIDLRPFGTGRQIRFGHLLGGDTWHIVLAQCQKRIDGDAYCKISCLTAIDLSGRMLWQRGTPSVAPDLSIISCDVPLQLYDINGDGRDEVITAEDFEMLILDGATGQVIKRAKTPVSTEADEDLIGVPYGHYAFDRINPDGVRICNLSGGDRPTDILIKDRYCRLYALNSELELMWKFVSRKNTGHFPYALDLNGDGRDEIFCGYNLISSDGQLIWTLPVEEDHTDEIIPGKLRPDQATGTFALASGTQGFILADFEGHILRQDKVGHAQRISVGKYLPQEEGLQICLTNFWGHQGIMYLYDCYGRPVREYENGLNGNVITPVNWSGKGDDLILLNPDPGKGGLVNGCFEQMVPFPNDGHPTLCCEALDLTGDSRDELVVWDMEQLWIYTQDDGELPHAYCPVHYAHHNASNYRGEFHYPDASYLMEGTASAHVKK